MARRTSRKNLPALSSHDEEKILTAPEAAKYIRVYEKTLWELSAPRGPISVVRFKRCVRYEIGALKKFLASHTEQPA